MTTRVKFCECKVLSIKDLRENYRCKPDAQPDAQHVGRFEVRKRNAQFIELRMKVWESWSRFARTSRAGFASCVYRAVWEF